MERPRRTHAEARAQMRAGILRLGNEQLAEVGAAALSVREIARGLGVASSAIYRHVSNRDELLTMLLVDAYTDLADAALADDAPNEPAWIRLARLATGVRLWAVANPARWALAYGSPVPGYAAPAEETTGPGTRVMTVFLSLLAQGQAPDDSGCRPVSAPLAAELSAGGAELGLAAGQEEAAFARLAATAVEAWTGLIGLVSAEVFGQFGPDLTRHGAELLDRWIATTTVRCGLR